MSSLKQWRNWAVHSPEGPWEEWVSRIRGSDLEESGASREPSPPEHPEVAPARDPEVVARVKRLRGKLARPRNGLLSEELHRERQADKLKENNRRSRSSS